MAIFTKGLIGAGLAGTVVLGAMVSWDGGLTVDSAKDKITEAATQIGVFKTNETALVSKVTSLKTEKATLTAEVAALKVELAAEKAKNVTDNQRILDLEAEIATKNAKITELETEIATLNTDLENAAGNTAEITERINALEAELNAANEQAEELQYTLDTTVFAEPDQTAVNEAIDGEVIIPDPVDNGWEPEVRVADSTNVKMETGVPANITTQLKLDRKEDGTIVLINVDGDKTYTAVVNGNTYIVPATFKAEVAIGNAVDLDQHNLAITGGASINIWLTNN